MMIGWFVGRQRPNGPALVVLCVIASIAVDVWFGWPYVQAVFHPHPPLLLRFYLGHVFDMIIAVAGMPVAMMCAGLVSAGYGRLTQAGGGSERVLP